MIEHPGIDTLETTPLFGSGAQPSPGGDAWTRYRVCRTGAAVVVVAGGGVVVGGGGVVVAGGLTVVAGGLTVVVGGLTVVDGGLTVVVGGLTVVAVVGGVAVEAIVVVVDVVVVDRVVLVDGVVDDVVDDVVVELASSAMEVVESNSDVDDAWAGLILADPVRLIEKATMAARTTMIARTIRKIRVLEESSLVRVVSDIVTIVPGVSSCPYYA